MRLSAIQMRNYRGFEETSINNIELLNVLIGRNNVGKSSVYTALRSLHSVLLDEDRCLDRIPTYLDPNRVVLIRIQFELSDLTRCRLINEVLPRNTGHFAVPDDHYQSRRLVLHNGRFCKRIAIQFEAPPGRPRLLGITQVELEDEIGEFSVIIRANGIGEPTAGYVGTNLRDVLRSNHATPLIKRHIDPLSSDYSTSETLPTNLNRHIPWVGMTYLLESIREFFRKCYYFDAYRRPSPGFSQVQSATLLESTGANLTQVLTTLYHNNTCRFAEISRFIQTALPGIGTLGTRLSGANTGTVFTIPDHPIDLNLEETGGGVSQLLMIAVVLHTTDPSHTLLIEEPECHLHPGAQRFLMEHLERTSQAGRQVFLTTHSPTIINLIHRPTVYHVSQSSGRSIVTRIDKSHALSEVFQELGVRNSDLLLSDGVVFVEGPADEQVLTVWSRILGRSLHERNLTIITMGGGESAYHARVRSETLERLSSEVRIPHLFLLDADERSHSEIERLETELDGRILVLQRRELENYLLDPSAILRAMQDKYSDSREILQRVNALRRQDIQQVIDDRANELYGMVLLKRIRRQLSGISGGLLTREMAVSLCECADDERLAYKIHVRLLDRVGQMLTEDRIETIVLCERRRLITEWADVAKRRYIAPGEELLQAAFNHVGGRYEKAKDAKRIAEVMNPADIADEIGTLIERCFNLGCTDSSSDPQP